MKKQFLIILLAVFIPFNLAFADTNRDEFVRDNLSDLLRIINLIPQLSVDDLDISSDLRQEISDELDFDLKIKGIYQIFDKTRVNVGVNYNSGDNKFNSWKIRLTCDDGLEGYIQGNGKNICNTITDKHSILKEGGYIDFENKNQESSAFATIKFRAFDQNGNWLESQKINVIIPAN